MASSERSASLGELISVLYVEFLAVYHDEELASVAVAATINDMMADAALASTSHQSTDEMAA